MPTIITRGAASAIAYGFGFIQKSSKPGNVYVANNTSPGTVSKITPSGIVTTTWATVGSYPYGIAIY